MKKGRTLETYGLFHIGNHTQFSLDLFDALEGSHEISPESVMTIDLIKRVDNIPYPMALKHCTLPQLGQNVKRLESALTNPVSKDSMNCYGRQPSRYLPG